MPADWHRRQRGRSHDGIRPFALLEHEVQHHGQLIRFVYGNRLTFPASWDERYTV